MLIFFYEQMYLSWFQTFAVIWILYIFFWVFPRRPIVAGRRFGTMYQFHLQRLGVQCVHPAFEDGTDTGFRNVGQLQFDAGEIPKRKYTIFKSRRKSEIKKDHPACSIILQTEFMILYRTAWPLKMGPIDCPETSVSDYLLKLQNILEEGRSTFSVSRSSFLVKSAA